MRRTLAINALVVGFLLAGCSEEADPIVGEWIADGPQPPGFGDFGDSAEIRVDEAGEATLGTPPASLCGGATVTAKESDESASAGGEAAYTIEFPTTTWCVTVNVPQSLEIVIKGDTLEATPTGSPAETPFRFSRAREPDPLPTPVTVVPSPVTSGSA